MKKRTILGLLSIACLSSSCTTTTYEPPKISFDPTIMGASVDGFRIEMSARMAKQVAEERGYKIDSRYSHITFDDVIEAGPIGSYGGPYIYLERDLEKTIVLSFDYGRVTGIVYEHYFFQRQQGEELLESYLKKYPQLTLLMEKEDARSYQYMPNTFASLSVSIKIYGEERCDVRISLLDRNHSRARHNAELYEEMEAIRRRY